MFCIFEPQIIAVPFCLFAGGLKNGELKWIVRNGKGSKSGNSLAKHWRQKHTVKRNKKNVTVIKKTPCAYVKDLKESIITYVEDSARY